MIDMIICQLSECLCPNLTMSDVASKSKAFKLLYGHWFCAPLILCPGTTVPQAPSLRHWSYIITQEDIVEDTVVIILVEFDG